MTFFNQLNFSSSNEDGATERAALAGAKRILCLTGSGTRPLDMLLTDADHVTAIDVNPTQNALLQLKCAAIEVLDHHDYLAFLGIGARQDGLGHYRRVRPRLPPEVKALWDQRSRMIGNGVWYAGKWERLLIWNARLLHLLAGRALKQLRTVASVEEQAVLWQEHIETRLLRSTVELLGRQWIWKWIMREPAGEFLPPAPQVSRRLAEDFARAARSFLLRESDFACLVFWGRVDPRMSLPLHLRPENYEIIRARLGRINIVQGDLRMLPALNTGIFDGFSLSDFGSYCGVGDYARCWNGISAVSADGAKFCERIFMNEMAPPLAQLAIDHPLSARLTERDRAIIYKIRAGEIHQP